MCDHGNLGGCAHTTANPSVQQTLDELDFSRGIWSAALDGCYDDVLSCLRKKNFSVDTVDSSGYTALHYASRNGHLAVCQLLLNENASPNIQTKSGGVTPLHRAAYCGHAEITNLLLKHKADPLIPDTDGKLPLHKASEGGHIEVVKILLNASPGSRTYADIKGRTAADCVPDKFMEVKLLLGVG